MKCERCGKVVERTSYTQKYCIECRPAVKDEKTKESRLRALERQKFAKQKKYDWVKIERFCKEKGLSYGKAQNLGLLDDERFLMEV